MVSILEVGQQRAVMLCVFCCPHSRLTASGKVLPATPCPRTLSGLRVVPEPED